MVTNICRCGKTLPQVKPTETPFQFCSLKCKNDEKKQMVVHHKKGLSNKIENLEWINPKDI